MNLGTIKINDVEKKIDCTFAEETVKENYKKATVKGKEGLYFFYVESGGNNNGKYKIEGLSSSKLRGLLDLVNNIYSKVYYSNDKDLSRVLDDIAYLQVKYAYEAGREKTVKKFLDKSKLMQLIPDIIQKNDKKFFFDYYKYFEAYVAYMKYYGMED